MDDEMPEFMRRNSHVRYSRHDKLMAANTAGAGLCLMLAGLWTLGRLVVDDLCHSLIGASAACFAIGFAGTLSALSF